MIATCSTCADAHVPDSADGQHSASAAQEPIQQPQAAAPALRHIDSLIPHQHRVDMPAQHMQLQDVPLVESSISNGVSAPAQRQPILARQGQRRQGRHAQRQPSGSFSAPRPHTSHNGPSVSAHQARLQHQSYLLICKVLDLTFCQPALLHV